MGKVKGFTYLAVLTIALMFAGCEDSKEQLIQAQQAAKDAQKELAGVKAELAQTNSFNELLKANIEEMEEKIQSYESLYSDIADLQDISSQYISDLSEIKRQRNSATAIQDSLAEQVELLQNELSRKNTELAELNKWAAQAQKTIQQLQTELGIADELISMPKELIHDGALPDDNYMEDEMPEYYVPDDSLPDDNLQEDYEETIEDVFYDDESAVE
jgi:chromosome segregation ATPase